MLKERYRLWVTSIGILMLALVILVIAASPLRGLFASPERLQEEIKTFGWYAPAVVVLIQFVQVIVAPIPGQAIDIANGYLFGWLWGSVISFVGIAIGSVAAIWLARRFGRPLVVHLVTPKGLKEIQPYLKRRNQWFFFFLFLVPGTPDDLLCFAIGLSSIPYWRAVAIALLGRAPGIVAAVIAGSTGQSLNPITFTIIAILVSVVMFWIAMQTPLAKVIKPTTNKKAR